MQFLFRDKKCNDDCLPRICANIGYCMFPQYFEDSPRYSISIQIMIIRVIPMSGCITIDISTRVVIKPRQERIIRAMILPIRSAWISKRLHELYIYGWVLDPPRCWNNRPTFNKHQP